MENFAVIDTDPGGTLQRFNLYVDRIELMCDLIFRKSDGSAYTPSDKEKKSLLLFRGGNDMKMLFEHVGKVTETDTFKNAIEKIKTSLKARTNKVVQRNLLFSNFPQGSKSFERWSIEISDAAKLIDYTEYDWQAAAVDAMVLQTSNSKLREMALRENAGYDKLMSIGVAKEQSEKGALLLAGSSTRSSGEMYIKEEDVRKIRVKGKQRKCARCGKESHQKTDQCPALGETCHKCKKGNHFASMCKTRTKPIRQIAESDDSEDEELNRIIEVKKLNYSSITTKMGIRAADGNTNVDKNIELATDTGVRKTILNKNDWEKIRLSSKLVKTSKGFRPYGISTFRLPIIGRAHVTLTAERGASINTWIYVVNSEKESSLLGETDAIRLGIVKLDLKGAAEEVRQITYIPRKEPKDGEIVSGQQTQHEIDETMQQIRVEYGNIFSDSTGKIKEAPIKIQYDKNAKPVIQRRRKIARNYLDPLPEELKSMLADNVIEGPIDNEEPGTFISNLVITDKKDTDRIRVTLDCQDVNRHIYATHEPIPTPEELRHKLKGSDRFSKVDLTNCYHQFVIKEDARKLFMIQTPWGLYRYKRMVMGTSPASSEIQKRMRLITQSCRNVVQIKDDIIIHGKGKEHDECLKELFAVLQKRGATLRPGKCALGKTSITWFGYVFSKDGMSPDPEKCAVIKNWLAPKSVSEVKSFLHTVQFNSKFLGGKSGEASYPELTQPLRSLTKRRVRFKWGAQQES